MHIPPLKIASLMGKTGLGKITHIVTQEVTIKKVFKIMTKTQYSESTADIHPKSPRCYFGGLLPGQVDVNFHINFQKIKNIALGIVFFTIPLF